ncbi:WD40/YVTN/BNR-like repeat-containing protein [Variovorax rhizosphaerae]|uniref:YCF48-related protein n=1 Tax=Variovorax rhizosphaerae TaxID=1836200 RepID=A0ABU8WTP4_9BURK
MKAKRATMAGRAAAMALVACTTVWAAQGVDDKGWRDVLDTPAARSPYASRALLNGLANAGARTVAVGQRGQIVYTDDAGKTWRQAEVPVSSDLVAVSFPTPATGWAVGHDGVVLRSTDAGQTWALQLDGRRLGALMVDFYTREANASLSGDPKRTAALVEEAKRFEAQGAENPFLDVWFRDASNGYVVGAFGLALRTSDGGAHWEPMLHAIDNPKGQHLYAVRGIGADVYMTGEQGLLLKQAQGDARFRALDIPYKGTLFGLTGSAQSLVAYGLRGTVIRSTDGGRNWQPVSTGLQAGLTASTRDGEGRLLIVSQVGHVLMSRDDGASFTPIPFERSAPAAAVAVPAKGTLLIAGPRGAQALQLP